MDSFAAASAFGLLAVELFTTTGMRMNEGMQIRLDPDCFVCLELPAPPGADDQLSWSPDGTWIAFTTTYMESDGPITAIHLSIINPFDDDPDVHTLLRDLSDFTAPAWRESPATDP